jgi:hypothetical protein
VTKTVKAKPLTKIQQLERKISILESAVYQHYTELDELHGVIWMLRKELEQPQADINIYQARKVLDAIFSLSIKQQCDLMDYADLEY